MKGLGLRCRVTNDARLFTGLSALTWLLPERWGESELSLETLHTAINLLGSMHDAIMRQAEGPPAPGTDLGLLLGALQQVRRHCCHPDCLLTRHASISICL